MIEKKETVRFPKIKDYNSHQSTKYIPRYIAGGGPIKQQHERGPHYHHNVQENVLYKIPYQYRAPRNPAICCAGQPKGTLPVPVVSKVCTAISTDLILARFDTNVSVF